MSEKRVNDFFNHVCAHVVNGTTPLSPAQ
jgi:hypothetical protein